MAQKNKLHNKLHNQFLMKKNILWLAANPSMVMQFYLPHLRNMVASGGRVSLVSNFNDAADKKKQLENLGVMCVSLPIQRGGKNIIGEAKTLFALWRLVARQRPDMINALSLKMVLYGGLVARCKNIKFLGNLTGLGFIFISKKLFAKSVRLILKIFLPFIFSSNGRKLLVMNHDDFALMEKKFFIKKKNLALVLGVGVDDDYFIPSSNQNKKKKKTIITMARLLRDKGIVEFCHAASMVKANFAQVDFLIYGASDDDNPSSLPHATIQQLKKCGVRFMGHTNNSKLAISNADAVALFSYREGLPQTLLEAGAMGKCLLALDAPGSKEICRHGISGLLVRDKNPKAMAEAMEKILNDDALRQRLGRGGRDLVEKHFSLKKIEKQMLAIWQEILLIKT